MKMRGFRLMLLPDGTSRALEFRLSRLKLYVLLPLGTLAVLSCTAYAVSQLSDTINGYRLRQLEREKTQLNGDLRTLKEQLAAVGARVEDLVDMDEDLRKFADLPPIHEDVRQVGVGGSIAPPVALTGFHRATGELVRVLAEDLGKFERVLDLELESYDEISEKLEYQQEFMRHLPSIRPVKGGRITDNFGPRKDPITKNPDFHNGIDVNEEIGAPIFATADGVVEEAGRRLSYGNYVKINHQTKKFGYATAYGHLRKFFVKKGQKIKRGDIIGEVGNTGRVTARHLHYEVWVDGHPVDPQEFYYDPSVLY